MRNSFSCYLRILNQNFSLHFQLWCPQGSNHNSAWQNCDNFNQNPNQKTLASIRYTDERYRKALIRFEIYFCIINSHVKKLQRALRSRVSYVYVYLVRLCFNFNFLRVRSHERRNEHIPVWDFKPAWNSSHEVSF